MISEMLSLDVLPKLNAILNTLAAVLLVLGHRFMKKGNIAAHKRCMIGVVTVSALFLTSYLTYHSFHGSEPFSGTGWVRPVYFAILLSHSLLAAAIVPMALITLWRGLRRNDERHKAIARWTYPIWIYVSVTGVLIYLLLYHLFPGGAVT